MGSVAVFPGTFNPVTKGHVDIIRRAAKVSDQLIVAVGKNVDKDNNIFSISEKIAMLEDVTKDIPNVKIDKFSGLIIDYAKGCGARFLIKGLRSSDDLHYEYSMALANRSMGGIETIFLMADPCLAHLSSTLIREIATFGHRLTEYVPEEIEDIVFQRFQIKN